MENREKTQSQSEEIKELIAALAKAQGTMRPAVFNRVNPHFKNRYADFTSVMDACREPLAHNGLAVMQYCENVNDKLMLVTMLSHLSGQWVKSYFPLNPLKMDSQSIGSAMTYGKRYSLSALLGIVSDDEDDDGESSQGRGIEGNQKNSQKTNEAPKQPARPPIPEKITQEQVTHIKHLEVKLNEECKRKIYSWLESSYKVKRLEDLLKENFDKVLSAFQNAIKFMEQQLIDQKNLEVAHV